LMVTLPAVLFASAQDPLRVMVTTWPLVEPVVVPVQVPVKPENETVGVAGMVNPAGKVTEIVLPEARAPVEDVVKLSVQLAEVLATWELPVKETAETEVAAVIVIPELGLTAVASCEVATLNPLAG